MNSLINSFCQSRRYLQSLYLFRKLLPFSKPEFSTLPSILKSCSSLDAGLVNHGYLIKCGLYGCCADVGNDLLRMYVKLGEYGSAYKVFDEMPFRNNDNVFDCIIHEFTINQSYKDIVIAFEMMVDFHVIPSVYSLCHVIKACTDFNIIEKGQFLHNYVTQNGFDNHIFVMNLLISMYVKMGNIDLAQQVFDNMIRKDIVSWNSLITGYAQNKNWFKVFDLFLCLRQAENLVPNVVTFLGLVSCIGHAKEIGIGESIHGYLIRTGLYSDVQLGTAIFDMYAKCEKLDYAETVFEQDLIKKTLISWNSLIATYKQNGYDQKAVIIYERMVVEPNPKPDSFSFANVLPAYANLGNIKKIKLIHSTVTKSGLNIEKDVVLCTSMLDAYGKCLDVKAAEFLFTCVQQPNTATWNALIGVYNINNQIENGMIKFKEMVRNRVSLDSITMVTLFQSCGQMGCLRQCNMIHAFSFLKGFLSNLVVGNALIDMYMKCECTKSAEIFFRSMIIENIVTWNTMIYGYMKNGCSSLGLKLLREMQESKEYKPDSVTIISLLQGSLPVAYLELFHCYIIKLGLISETQIMNILIDSYAKIGIIDKAKGLFNRNDFIKDQSSWNIMISGYGMNGQGDEASELFNQMVENGYLPDSITFISLLSSCSHCGLVENGCKFFDQMVNKYKIQPSMEHWTCVIDMLGRANGLEEAYDVIKNGILQKSGEFGRLNSVAVWGALLSACRNNMNMEVGQIVGRKLCNMESGNIGYYSLISNLYSSNEKWDEVIQIRKVFGDGKVIKKPGLSSLES